MSKLQTIQKKCLGYIGNSKYNAHADPLFLKYDLLNVCDTVDYNLGIFMYQNTNGLLPDSFEDFFKKLQSHHRNLNYLTKGLKYSSLKSLPSNSLPLFWNSLSLDIKRCSSLQSFKTKLSDFLRLKYNTVCNKQNCYSCQ